jgi:transcriptional regulator with XRE-family HTH domain
MANKLKNRTVEPDGEAIQRLRIEKGWRVEDLAKKARCSLKTVENVERGANVYLYTLSKVAQALGVEVSTLMTGAAPRAYALQFLKITADTQDFFEKIRVQSCHEALAGHALLGWMLLQ